MAHARAYIINLNEPFMYTTRRSAVNYQSSMPKVHHVSTLAVKKLFVRKTSGLIILKEWKIEKKGTIQEDRTYYVECSRTGTVNWDNTSVYTADELVARDNVHIVTLGTDQ